MPGALIVSSGEKGRDMLCGVLTDMGAGDISTVTSGAEARRGFAAWRTQAYSWCRNR